MERTPVSSSNIDSIGYNEDTHTLEVQFKGRKGATGSVYQYSNVPLEVWHSFLRAPSKGGYFASSVKGAFAATKVS